MFFWLFFTWLWYLLGGIIETQNILKQNIKINSIGDILRCFFSKFSSMSLEASASNIKFDLFELTNEF